LNNPVLSCLAYPPVIGTLLSCTGNTSEPRKPKATFFIGVDAGGSFRSSSHYENALSFLAH
jgi:hypothetical protein